MNKSGRRKKQNVSRNEKKERKNVINYLVNGKYIIILLTDE